MRSTILCAALLPAMLLGFAGAARGQAYTFTATGLLGLGGSIDESDSGFGNFNWQLGFASSLAENTRFGVRLGGLEWGSSDRLGPLGGPSLLYLTLAGEYRESSGSFSGGFMEPGVFLGLGFYRLEGMVSEELEETDESLGLVVGVTGDMHLNSKRTLGLRLELAGHYTNLDSAQLFAVVGVGLAYRF